MPKQEVNPKNYEAVANVCETEGLEIGYIVCRAMPVLPAFVGKMDAWPQEEVDKCTFHSPLLDPTQGARLFASREEAESYAERKTEDLHKPFIDENGHECFRIEMIEMTDYLVVPIAVVESKPAEVSE